MILFLSDLHLGRGSAKDSASAERDAVALLRSHRDALNRPGGRLILLGDVFNAFLEYGMLVPSGFVRLQGVLAELVDAGVDVTYVVGNRDPWHVAHFEKAVGIKVSTTPLRFEAFGRGVIATHGDEFESSNKPSRRLRPVLRHPLAYWLYRNLLPGDSAFRVARWISRLGDGEPDESTVEALRASGLRLLETPGVDLVVMGHSHRAELSSGPAGTYVNCGYWLGERTYCVLDRDGVRLCTWGTEP